MSGSSSRVADRKRSNGRSTERPRWGRPCTRRCSTGCCCGHTERGHQPVNTELYHREWARRKIRHKVHFDNLTPLYPDEKLKLELPPRIKVAQIGERAWIDTLRLEYESARPPSWRGACSSPPANGKNWRLAAVSSR